MITINIEKVSKAGKLREHFSLKTGAGCKRLFAVFVIEFAEEARQILQQY